MMKSLEQSWQIMSFVNICSSHIILVRVMESIPGKLGEKRKWYVHPSIV